MAEMLTGALPAQAPAETNGLAFFAASRVVRLLDSHHKPLGMASLGHAQFVWGKWLAFCSRRGLAWRSALSADLRVFAATLSPRRLGTTLAVSPVTLRRYRRLLNDLYARAVLRGHIEKNPACAVMPTVSEKTPSLALSPSLWALLQEGLPAGFGLKVRRDRLVLLWMMRCALTVGEIMALTLGSVEAHAGSPEAVAKGLALTGLPLRQPESTFWTPLSSRPALGPAITYALQLSGPRPARRRRLVLDARTSCALADYLEVRTLGQAALKNRLVVGSAQGAAITAWSLYGIG